MEQELHILQRIVLMRRTIDNNSEWSLVNT